MSEHKKVLFFAPYTGPWAWFLHTRVDAVVATALRLRGCEVSVVGCDGVYRDCYIIRGAGNRKQEFCQICSRAGQEFFSEKFELPYTQLRDFINQKDREEANQWIESVNPESYGNACYRDLALGKWVTSSIYTFFRITSKSLSIPDVVKVHRQYLIDGFLTYKAISKIFDLYQPTNLFLFGARLAPYRVVFEVARNRKIDVIVQERGFVNNKYRFFDNHHCLSTKPVIDFCNSWKNIPLTKTELEEVKQYFIDREYGRNTNGEKFYEYKTEYADALNKLKIPIDAKIFAVFTSSEDELALFEEYGGITKQLEVIDRLIDIFSNREEYLVIRHHPNIAGNHYNIGETDFLSKAYQQALSAPKNVRIVMPSEQLTSYALLWHSDAAIGFFSTMAIEAPVRGIPTASFDKALYRQALKFGISNIDRESLATLVDNLLSESARLGLEELRKLYRFTHAYFHKFSVEFRSLDAKSIKYESDRELEPGSDPVLDKVCDRIMYGNSIYNLPSSNLSNRSTEEEDEFLARELQEIKEHRESVREKTLEQNELPVLGSLGIIYLDYHENPELKQELSAWIKKLRYNADKIKLYHSKVFNWKNFQEVVRCSLEKLTNVREDYVLLTNSFIQQYDASVTLSAFDILAREENQATEGVFFGGWLPFSQRNVEYRIFTRQGIFTPHDPAKMYPEAMEILPLLYYVPTSILAFGIFRKKTLVSLLETIKEISTVSQMSETLFKAIAADPIQNLELPMLVVDEKSGVFKELWKNDLKIALKHNFRLREINFIIFPDWSQSEEAIYNDFARVLKAIASHPDKARMTLLVNTSNIDEKEADMAVSSIVMNLLMEEDLDVEEGPEISLVGELGYIQWEALLSCVRGIIGLEHENKEAIAQVEAESIPAIQLESLPDAIRSS